VSLFPDSFPFEMLKPRSNEFTFADVIAPGYHASTESEYAASFAKALSMSDEATLAMRKRARASSKRFTEDAFATKWTQQLGRLIDLQRKASQ